MFKISQHLRASFIAAPMLAAVIFTGCASHVGVGVGYRVYDPYYRDYHVWGPEEGGYYNQWVIDNHREQRDYRRLKRNDQRQYWQWRQSAHPEPNHERRERH